MAQYICTVCEYLYDEELSDSLWIDLPADWICPVCGSPKRFFEQSVAEEDSGAAILAESPIIGENDPLRRTRDEIETTMADIHLMAETGTSITEPMRTRKPTFSWDDLLIKGAQIARLPLNSEEEVSLTTVIGPRAAKPLVIDTPIFITHMSFGALSREAKIALARGSAAVNTAMCSGEGGILPESFESAYRYIFEYVPNRYSVTPENLKKVDAVEIKLGQSAKPGMGGHLPGEKVTEEIAAIRGFAVGQSISSPARFADILNADDLKRTVDWLREESGGRPVGIKLAAGNIEADLSEVLQAGPDFITLDGRAGATGAAPKFVKAAASVPTIFALYRARRFLDAHDAGDVSLLITGGLRVSSDFAKALALGATAVAIGTSALMAIGCRQYKICNTGKCPMGLATQDPVLRAAVNIEKSARRLENFLRVCGDELKMFARLTGNADVHGLSLTDVCTTNSEISNFTEIEHV